MSRHLVRLLLPALVNVVMAAFCAGFAIASLASGADSMVLMAFLAALYFGYVAIREVQQAWTPFVAELEHRKALRRAAPLTRINLRKDDTR